MIASVLSAVALAANPPINLECIIQQDRDSLLVTITVNEDQSSATVLLPTGRLVTRPASITPERVTIPDQEMTWIIDRVKGTINRKFGFMPPDNPGEFGKCSVKKPPAKRAF